MSNVRVTGRNFNDNLVGFQFTTGTPIFSLGTFEITTNLEPKVNSIYTLGGFSSPITLDTLSITTEANQKLIENNFPIYLNYDRSDLTNYAYFGSLGEYLRVSVEKIITDWTASIYVRNIIDGDVKINVLDYVYNAIDDTATFRVPVNYFQNKFELKYLSSDFIFEEHAETPNYRNITSYFTRYCISIAPFTDELEYNIIGFTGATDLTDDYIYIQTTGNAFSSTTLTTFSRSFHIKPQKVYVEEFFNELSGLEYYLLNRMNIPRYTAIFKRPVVNQNGDFDLTEERYSWPYTDGYNMDIDTVEYGIYFEKLYALGQSYDRYKTNLISRFFTAKSLKEFDTPDEKMDKLLKIYGREFDEIKLFIDSLAWVSTVTYDGANNIPNQLIKNLANILGWSTLSTVSENDILNLFLGVNNPSVFAGRTRDLTPAEIDIELWRRLVINSAWIWKAKGTRKVIEFIFRFIGAPDCLVDLDEHVYLVDNKLDFESVKTNLAAISGNTIDFNQIPIDENGFPKAAEETSSYYFQLKGGWFEENKEHIGTYDFGKLYFDKFRDLGFTLNPVIDDKKSWVYSSGQTRQEYDFPMRETDYTTKRSELVLNTKEVTLWLDPAYAIECDVHKFYKNSGCYDFTNLPTPYPINVFAKSAADMSLMEFLTQSYSKLINVRNRKTISAYPTLKMLYLDYLDSLEKCGEVSRAFKYSDMTQFIDYIDKSWLGLIAQLIPATTIWQSGEKYRNTIFDRQKFIYKRGIDEGSEFAKRQPDVLSSPLTPLSIVGNVILPTEGEIDAAPIICGVYTTATSQEILFDCRVSGVTVEISCDICQSPFSSFEYTYIPRCLECIYKEEILTETVKYGALNEATEFSSFSLFQFA